MDKTNAATKAAFGDGIENMLSVVYLATSPEHQGKGYGTTLVAAANAEVKSPPTISVSTLTLNLVDAFGIV